MKKIFLTLIIGFLGFQSFAQTEFRDRFFIGLVSSYYIDFISSPLQIVDRSEEIAPGFFTPDTAVPFQTRYISYFSFGIEPRYNILEFSDNMALGISSPFSIGFGQAAPHNRDVYGASGFGSFQFPLLLKFYMGSTATYASTDDIGLSLGAGFEFNKIAIFNVSEEGTEDNKGWIMPTFSGSFHFWRGNSPFEINVKYGVGREKSYTYNKDGGLLSGGRKTTKASSLKLSFIYLLDY